MEYEWSGQADVVNAARRGASVNRYEASKQPRERWLKAGRPGTTGKSMCPALALLESGIRPHAVRLCKINRIPNMLRYDLHNLS